MYYQTDREHKTKTTFTTYDADKVPEGWTPQLDFGVTGNFYTDARDFMKKFGESMWKPFHAHDVKMIPCEQINARLMHIDGRELMKHRGVFVVVSRPKRCTP